MAKTTDHKIYPDVELAEKKEGSFVNYTRLLIFFFAIRLRLCVILIPVCMTSYFSYGYRYRTQTQFAPESNTFSQDRALVSGFIH